MSRQQPTVLYVINVDWFFLSHFLPLASEAARRGFRPVVACEATDRHAAFAAAGIALRPLDLSRSDRRIARVWRAAGKLAAVLERERPAVVHAIGLEGMLVAVLAHRRARVGQLVLAPTGLGYASVNRGLSQVFHAFLRRGIRMAGGRKAVWIFENDDDPRQFGLPSGGSAAGLIVGGAGVDIEAFKPRPPPAQPPLRVALVARMIWSKGPDLAVAAVTALRQQGHDVTLTLVGEPDPFNPRALSRATLEQWNASEGIRWIGRQSDIAGVWARHHVACGPSRGGEGLPKSLLEAAACGRAVVTTDVPGCRAFIRDGVQGLVVPPGDPVALAAALRRFLDEPGLVGRMGAAARERVVADHTDTRIAGAVWDFCEAALLRDARRAESRAE